MSLIIILLFKNKERPVKEKIFCLTWFLVLMLPPLLIKNIFIDYLDHRFFLPLIGILLFLLFVFPKKWLRNGDIKISWLLVVFFLFFSIFTFIKSDIYSSPVTFYDTAISHNPNCALAYFNRGNIKSNMGDKPRAIEDYNNAIANDSNLLEAYINRGIIKSMKGDNVGAIKDYNKAIAINPNCAEAYNNIGNTNYSQSNNIGAVDNYNKAIAINPNYSEAYTNRAIVKYNLKDFTGTIEDCEKVLKLNPNNQNAIDLKTKAQQELQK
jgi:tetratricopeptide (TPR) repeat protein